MILLKINIILKNKFQFESTKLFGQTCERLKDSLGKNSMSDLIYSYSFVKRRTFMCQISYIKSCISVPLIPMSPIFKHLIVFRSLLMRALEKNRMWRIEELPKGKSVVVGCSWIFTPKFKADGTLCIIQCSSSG